MDETVILFMREMMYRYDDEMFTPSGKETKQQRNNAQSRACRNDCATISGDGVPFELKDLQHARKCLKEALAARMKGLKFDENRWMSLFRNIGDVIHDIIHDIGEKGCDDLLVELLDAVRMQRGNTYTRGVTIKRNQSAFICGWKTPTLTAYDRRSNTLRVNRSTIRRKQKIISGKGFYNNSSLRQDCVLIEAEDSRSSSKATLWIGKVLGLFGIGTSNSRSTYGNRSEDDDCNFAFVQYFDVVAPTDKIDQVLQCVKLMWAQKSCRRQVSDSSESNDTEWYGLINLACIRGVVHVVRGDYGIDGRGIYKNMDDVEWRDQQFLINRFFHDVGSKQIDFKELQKLSNN